MPFRLVGETLIYQLVQPRVTALVFDFCVSIIASEIELNV